MFVVFVILLTAPFISAQNDSPCLQSCFKLLFSIYNFYFSDRDRGDSSCGQSGGLKFYYDKVTKHCQPFVYNGCGGNQNRFDSAQACRDACSDVTVPSSSSHGHSMVLSVRK